MCAARATLEGDTDQAPTAGSATSAERPPLHAPCWPFQSDRGSLQTISCCGHAEQRVPKPVTTKSEEGLVCRTRAGHLAQRGHWALEANLPFPTKVMVCRWRVGSRGEGRKEGICSEACGVQNECPSVQCTQENTLGSALPFPFGEVQDEEDLERLARGCGAVRGNLADTQIGHWDPGPGTSLCPGAGCCGKKGMPREPGRPLQLCSSCHSSNSQPLIPASSAARWQSCHAVKLLEQFPDHYSTDVYLGLTLTQAL